jgi:hypothetical protein
MSLSSPRRPRLGALAACLLAISLLPPGAAATGRAAPPVQGAPPDIVAGPTVQAVTAGTVHTCVIRDDGTVGCWGDDSAGQASPPDGTFKAIDAFGQTTCGIRTDGSIACWGRAFETGNLLPTGSFRRVWVGWEHACALRDDDTLACWGMDDYGETEAPAGTFDAVAIGDGYTCAIRTDGILQCWGGNPDGVAVPVPTADTLLALDGTCVLRSDHTWWCWDDATAAWVQRAAGLFMATSGDCAIRVDGTLVCDARDDNVGLNTPPAGSSWEGLSEENLHACAIDADDQLTCWGGDWLWQRTPRPTPAVTVDPWRTDSAATVDWSARFALVPVVSYDVRYRRIGWDATRLPAWSTLLSGVTLTGATVPTAPGYTYCFSVRARDANGVASAWTNQPPDEEDSGCTTTPLDDRSLTRVHGFTARTGSAYYRGTVMRSTTAGDKLRVHLTATTGALLVTTCPTCGSIKVSFPGGGSETLSLVSPTTLHRRLIPLFGGPYSIVETGYFTISVVGSGKPVLIDGVLASPTQTVPSWADSYDPPQPGSGATVRPVDAIDGGLGYTCVIAGDGSGAIHCWGSDAAGEATAPAGSYRALDATYQRACAVRTDGTITCWGDMLLPLPAGTYLDVAGAAGLVCGVHEDGTLECNDPGEGPAYGGTFTAIEAGRDEFCAIRTNGTLGCFDEYQHPIASPEGTFLDLSMAEDHACGILADHTLTCWGDDSAGQSTPPAGTFADVAAGMLFTCAIQAPAGTLTCWGDDHYLEAEPPAGTYSAVGAGWHHACAIPEGTDGLACWGQDRSGEATPRPHAAMAALPEVTLADRTAVAWSGDGLAGVTGYDTRYRRYTWGTGWGSWTAWHTGTTATAASISLTGGRRTCVQARAHDGDGITGSYSVAACTTAPYDDRALARSSGWSAITGPAYYRATALRTTRNGARLVFHGVPDRSAAYLVATTCPTCGKVRVTWTAPGADTTSKVVNLYSSVTRNQRVLRARFTPWVPSARRGTLSITILSSGKKVVIDGLLLGDD